MPRPAPNPPASHLKPRITPPEIVYVRGRPIHRRCGAEIEQGYGLAGGGCGFYTYCPKCEIVLDKWQDPEME